MFRRLSEPLPLSEASLLALRPALNAPVLNAGFLPVGPARAAIVIFGEEWGGFGIALGIRSNESGQVAVFRNQESIESEDRVSRALEPLLAEAERLGFVFDEDMISGAADDRARGRAMGLWGRLMGELEIPPPAELTPSSPAESRPSHALPPRSPLMDPEQAAEAAAELLLEETAKDEELLLEDVAPASEPLPEVTLDTPLPSRPADPDRSLRAPGGGGTEVPRGGRTEIPRGGGTEVPQPALSRFRAAGSSTAGPAAAPEMPGEGVDEGLAANALGRIPIVRVRREREASRRLPFLARLLASF